MTAMMKGINMRSRSAAADDEGNDHLGFETPRSGVATPQPDLHDKRLPGIMSYFGQVRSESLSRLFSRALSISGQPATTPAPLPAATSADKAEESCQAPITEPNTSASPLLVEHISRNTLSDAEPPLPLSQETVANGPAQQRSQNVVTQLHPYPTPPTSEHSSIHTNSSTISPSQESLVTAASSKPSMGSRQLSATMLVKGHARAVSLLTPLPSMVTESNASAHHISSFGARASTVPSSPTRTSVESGDGDSAPSSSEFASVQQLKKLTNVAGIKSGTNTPTRALSVAIPSQVEPQKEEPRQEISEGPDRTATHTPTPAGAQAPAARGKLTIKIAEAKGLKQCRDPYVVVVFQRSELISSGPHVPLENDDAAIQAVAMGGVPIQRQGSDSGRPMAIPMRSRQSSNTSIHDYTTFRNRNSRRSFTNPKWDAEAVL